MISKALRLTENKSGLDRSVILSSSKKKEHVDARQAVVFALSRTGMTLEQIAEAIGYKDHSGVWHLINKRPILDGALVSYVCSGIMKKHHTNRKMLINNNK